MCSRFRSFPFPSAFFRPLSVPVLATWPLFLPFLFLPVSASQWLLRCSLSAFASLVFPVLSDLVSYVFFPGSSYSAFCLFPFILPGFAPTAVPPVLPFCSRFRAFPSLPLSFVRFRLVLTTQPSALSFPFFPFSPVGGSFGVRPFLSSLSLSSSVRPVSMPSFRFRYSASCVSFLRFSVSCHRHYAAPGLLFPARPFPFAFALGSGYSACLF